MNDLLIYLQANIHFAPYIILGLLLLAGLNIPVSEDMMLFLSGFLASKYPDQATAFFICVFLGAYFSDLICYWLGRQLGPKLWDIKIFAKFADKKKVEKMEGFYKRNGFLTLLFGRFIPFGVRNAIFLTAGLSKFNFIKFAISDLIACSISCSAFFYLYFNFGESVIEYVKKGNVVIFSLVAIGALIYFIKNRKKVAK